MARSICSNDLFKVKVVLCCSGAAALRARGVLQQRVHVAVRRQRSRGGGGGRGRSGGRGGRGPLAARPARALRGLQHAHRARLAPA